MKWGRETFPNVEVNTDEDPMVFKAQLFALTGVQPNRQKVMCKGLALKDNEWNMPLKDVCYSLKTEKKDIFLNVYYSSFCYFLYRVQ